MCERTSLAASTVQTLGFSDCPQYILPRGTYSFSFKPFARYSSKYASNTTKLPRSSYSVLQTPDFRKDTKSFEPKYQRASEMMLEVTQRSLHFNLSTLVFLGLNLKAMEYVHYKLLQN